MATIVILGAGAMGSAFCFPIADSGHEVRLVGTHLDDDIISELKKNQMHPKLKMCMPYSVNYYYDDEIAEAFNSKIDLIVLGVNSAGIDWAIEKLLPYIESKRLLILTKGLAVEGDRLMIIPDYVKGRLQEQNIVCNISAVGGPCIAAELAARRDTQVTFGCSDMMSVKSLKELLKTPYYHVSFTKDLIGLEVSAALKNFYALAVGCPDGFLEMEVPLGNYSRMNNLSASLFTQAIRELVKFVSWMGGNRDNVYDLPGIGDLYVTCQAGRNSRMGKYLGMGIPYSVAKHEKMPFDTVEGAELALKIGPIVEKCFSNKILEKSEYPLANTIINSVCHDKGMVFPWELFGRTDIDSVFS